MCERDVVFSPSFFSLGQSFITCFISRAGFGSFISFNFELIRCNLFLPIPFHKLLCTLLLQHITSTNMYSIILFIQWQATTFNILLNITYNPWLPFNQSTLGNECTHSIPNVLLLCNLGSKLLCLLYLSTQSHSPSECSIIWTLYHLLLKVSLKIIPHFLPSHNQYLG